MRRYKLTVTSIPASRIYAIKGVRELTHMNLMDAKNFVDRAFFNNGASADEPMLGAFAYINVPDVEPMADRLDRLILGFNYLGLGGIRVERVFDPEVQELTVR